jgi:hypothetical protein
MPYGGVEIDLDNYDVPRWPMTIACNVIEATPMAEENFG